MSAFNEKKAHINEILQHAIAAVDPCRAVKRILNCSGSHLLVDIPQSKKRYQLQTYENIIAVGCGKAGAPMSCALEEVIGERISGGLVVVKYGHIGHAMPRRIRLVESGHPEPDEPGMHACADTIGLLKKADAHTLVIALISGGGSALWPQPVAGVTLEEKRMLTSRLLACGADIHEINAIRKHVSLIKGGWAARYAKPADVLVCAVSDVVGDEIDTIASGPFAPDTTTFADAWRIITKYGLDKSISASIGNHLQQGVAGRAEETPGQQDEAFRKVTHVLCATNEIALEAAGDKAHMLGYEPIVIAAPLTGECREAAKDFCLRLGALQQNKRSKPLCVICGGETTVTLGNTSGTGGRNQEFALASAFLVEKMEKVVVASCGTDGTDGPTDAAGAIVDCATLARARNSGFDPQKALDRHNAYPLFSTLGDLIITGPTGTNVMDIQIGIVGT
jgi:hydroxypyruvate reductase